MSEKKSGDTIGWILLILGFVLLFGLGPVVRYFENHAVVREIDDWHYHMTVVAYSESCGPDVEAYVFTKDNCGHPDYAIVPDAEIGNKGRVRPEYKQVYPIFLNPDYRVEGAPTAEYRYMSRASHESHLKGYNLYFNCSLQGWN